MLGQVAIRTGLLAEGVRCFTTRVWALKYNKNNINFSSNKNVEKQDATMFFQPKPFVKLSSMVIEENHERSRVVKGVKGI